MILSVALVNYQSRIQKVLESILGSLFPQDTALPLAMQYAVLNGGKRVRPLLVYASAAALQLESTEVDELAAAVELIHCYSLIHDDLPAMDDDDLRRGKPTCHKAFDEATAILAGDALQTLAFELLSNTPFATAYNAEQRLNFIKILSQAAGYKGMVGGQALDLAATAQTLSIVKLNALHKAKTGALIKACIDLPLCAANISPTATAYTHLQCFAEYLGLAFQIQDDILDIESPTEILGKNQGADEAQNKSTYPRLLGLEGAKQEVQRLYTTAINALEEFSDHALLLKELAAFIIQRSY